MYLYIEKDISGVSQIESWVTSPSVTEGEVTNFRFKVAVAYGTDAI